jgi:hypothetical protein
VLVQENFALLYKKESEKCDARDDNKYLSSYTGDFYLHRANDRSAKNAFAILNADRSTRSVSRNLNAIYAAAEFNLPVYPTLLARIQFASCKFQPAQAAYEVIVSTDCAFKFQCLQSSDVLYKELLPI